MAEDIAFNLDINSGGGAKSLSDLKREFKELQTELSNTKTGTADYQKTLEKLGAVKDDIGDLRDTINALNPEGKVAAFAKVGSTIASGFAAAQGAAALFGAESEELQKTMLKVQAAMALAEGIKGIAGAADAFKVLNAVMKANPIFLIVGAITAVGVALFALKDKIGVIGDAFTAIGNAIDWVMDKVTAFTDAIGISNSALTKQGEQLTNSINTSTDALNKQTQAYDDQIAIAKASGKSTIDLEIAKQKAIIETNKALVEQTIAYVRNGGELDKERAKLLTSQLEDIKKANVQIKVIEATDQKERIDNYKKHLKEKEDADRKAYETKRDLDEKALEEWVKTVNAQEALRLQKEKDDAKRAEDEQAEKDAAFLTSIEIGKMEYQSTKENEEKKRAEKQKTAEDGLNMAQKSLQATQALTDLYFAHQLRQSKGNADKEREIRKKQFNVNKAFGIANAVIDGARGVQAALALGPPAGYVFAAISAIMAGLQIAKIASTKFDDGGSGGNVPADSGGLGATATAPAIPQPNNTVTQIKDDGSIQKASSTPLPEQKVVVYEGEMTKKQERIVNIEETAKIG